MSNVSLSSFSGTVDLTQLIPALMEAERAPITRISQRSTAATNAAAAYKTISDLATSLGTAGKALWDLTAWQPTKATSSSATVTASTQTGAVPGTLTFTVDAVARAQAIYSTAPLASTSAAVATPSTRLVLAAGGTRLGLQTLTGSSALAIGATTIEVTQASAAAARTGAGALAAGTTIDGTNDSLTVELNGVSATVQLAHATYATGQGLAEAVQDAIDGAPSLAGLRAELGSGGALVLRSTEEGSDAAIQVTGGSALTDLGLSVDATATTGTDALVEVGGVETSITSVLDGGTIVLDAGDVEGTPTTITAVTGSGLRAGTLQADTVDTGDGSLQNVVSAINGTHGAVVAAAVQVSSGVYRLQLSSAQTGVDGAMNIDMAAFAPVGGFTSLTDAADAQVTITGDNPYSITSSTNTFDQTMPGVSFTVSTVSTDPVTLTVSPDRTSLASKVQSMVSAYNQVVNAIKSATAYSSTTGSKGVLSGDAGLRRLAREINDAVVRPVDGATPTSVGMAGVTLGKDGTLTFDSAAFTAAATDDPDGLERLFGATATGLGTTGVLPRLKAALDAATQSGTGYLVTAEDSERQTATRYQKQVQALQDRLVTYEANLRSRFSIMNATLQNLSSQQSWLASQLASLSA
jgi:flagellar hook-associated protein 2